ncbi:MAG: alpha/beta hydrolase [Pseudomonadales bacterium]|nr:alpha/beta hydrolase [Pseudomonadales bacterium]MBO7005812.1 alpha/beta hydrolase [Pseudomonadales bacterium]
MEITLDPELQAVVDAAAEANPNPPDVTELPIEMFRAGYVMVSQAQALADIPCDDITDLEVPGAAGAIGARLYVPEGAGDATLPGLIFIHGGGFMIGNLDTHDSVCRQLANGAHCRVIALDYRLAPEHKFPAAVEDAIAAATHITQNAADYGMDGSKMAVGGDSAGGNLSAIVCNHFAEKGANPFAMQLLIYPATDGSVETESRRELQEGITLDKKVLDYFFEGYLGGLETDDNDPRLNPAKAASFEGVARAHIVTAQYDPLRDEGKAYGDLLEAAGVQVSYKCYEGLMHNFILQTGVVSAAKNAVDDMAAALSDAFSA